MEKTVLAFLYALVAPGQSAESMLALNPDLRQAAHQQLHAALQALKQPEQRRPYPGAVWGQAAQPSQAERLVRDMRDRLAHYDYLLPGDYMPATPPTAPNWRGAPVPVPVTEPLLQWAGDIARQRTLMDLTNLLQQLQTLRQS